MKKLYSLFIFLLLLSNSNQVKPAELPITNRWTTIESIEGEITCGSEVTINGESTASITKIDDEKTHEKGRRCAFIYLSNGQHFFVTRSFDWTVQKNDLTG